MKEGKNQDNTRRMSRTMASCLKTTLEVKEEKEHGGEGSLDQFESCSAALCFTA